MRRLVLSAIEEIDRSSRIDRSRLAMELTLLRDYNAEEKFMTAKQIADFLMNLNPQTRSVFKEVIHNFELSLGLSVSAPSTVRSFSAIRRLGHGYDAR